MTTLEPALSGDRRDETPDEHTLAAIDRWLEYQLWYSRTPGAQVVVAQRDHVWLSRAYGWSDLERDVRMTTRHLFRIASHSKTFAATVVLQLVEAGRLSLEDPIEDHLEVLAGGPVGRVRVRELLEHTGGLLRDGPDADYWQLQRPFPDAAQLLEMASGGGLKTPPGAAFAYSNVGYSLVGLLVEAVTGQSFASVARHQVLDPLGLQDTAAGYLTERGGDYAVGYGSLSTATRRQPLPHVDTTAMDAATGFTSTAEDLARYFAAHALGDERLLPDRVKRLQQRVANLTQEGDDLTGYGWGMVVEEVDGRRFVGHSGGYPGHITKSLLDPVTGLVVVVLTNAMGGPATALARGVVHLLQAAAKKPAAPAPAPSATALARTGRWASAWGVVDVAALGGRLLVLDPTSTTPAENADELAEDDDGLRIRSGSGYGSVGEPVTFTPEGDGVAQLRYGGMTMHSFATLPDSPVRRLGGTDGPASA